MTIELLRTVEFWYRRDPVSKYNMNLLPVIRNCDPYSERFAAGEYLGKVFFHNIDDKCLSHSYQFGESSLVLF